MAEIFIRSHVLGSREMWPVNQPNKDTSRATATTTSLQADTSPEKPWTEKQRADYMTGAAWYLEEKKRAEEDAWIAAVAGKSK